MIPDKYQESINAARATVDFWVNIRFLSLFVLIEYVAFGTYTHLFKIPGWSLRDIINTLGVPCITIVIYYGAYQVAKRAAITWGNWVKSAFDLYIPNLCQGKLGFTPPVDRKQEKDLWEEFPVVPQFTGIQKLCLASKREWTRRSVLGSL